MALDVIDISAEGLAAYVVPECRTGRPQADLTGRKGARRDNRDVTSGRPPFNGM
jgi:hypothetical protein